MGCRHQNGVQHTKSNHRNKLGENAFQDLKAGCGWFLLHAHLQLSLTWRSPSCLLQIGVLGVEGVEHPAPPHWRLLAHPLVSHFWLSGCTKSYSPVSMSSNHLSKSRPLHMVRLQFLNTCSMGKSNQISCNTNPCTAPQWGLLSCQIASFKPQPIQL